jgi:hypothetical protein
MLEFLFTARWSFINPPHVITIPKRYHAHLEAEGLHDARRVIVTPPSGGTSFEGAIDYYNPCASGDSHPGRDGQYKIRVVGGSERDKISQLQYGDLIRVTLSRAADTVWITLANEP